MTSNVREGGRILGSLGSAEGKGIVRMEDRFDTDIDDVWSALTDPGPSGPLVRRGRGRPAPRRRVPRTYGAGVQLHVEDLADHRAGRERRDDVKARWGVLNSADHDLAANLS